jgi:hypothetical protein
MVKNAFYLFPVIFLCGLIACEKDLPKPTKDGKNTFGCKVNGKSWVPNGIMGPTPSPPVSLTYSLYKDDYSVRIHAIRRIKGIKDNIDIHLNNVNKPGTYSLNSDKTNCPWPLKCENYGRYYTYDPDSDYITSAQIGGTVTITRADTVAKIVSGNFSFKAVDQGGNQVTITKGRFDVKNR